MYSSPADSQHRLSGYLTDPWGSCDLEPVEKNVNPQSLFHSLSFSYSRSGEEQHFHLSTEVQWLVERQVVRQDALEKTPQSVVVRGGSVRVICYLIIKDQRVRHSFYDKISYLVSPHSDHWCPPQGSVSPTVLEVGDTCFYIDTTPMWIRFCVKIVL